MTTNLNPDEGTPVGSGSVPPSLNDFIINESSSRRERTRQTSQPKISAPESPVYVDVQRQREQTRTRLAGGLLTLLGVSLFGVCAYITLDTILQKDISEERKDMHRELITIVWTSQVTLVSGALGFYFASERSNNNQDK